MADHRGPWNPTLELGPPSDSYDGPRAAELEDGGLVAVGERFLLWRSGALYLTQGADTDLHTHHAIQISISTGEDPIRTRIDQGREIGPASGIIIAADEPHGTLSSDECLQVYIDPESVVGRRIGSRVREVRALELDTSPVRDAVAALREFIVGSRENINQCKQAYDAITLLAAGNASAPPLDSRVQKVLAQLQAAPGTSIPLADLAALVNLSPSRLNALFSEQVGIPIRKYILWIRELYAIYCFGDGESVTRAAHSSGFSDGAHLSRTHRRHFFYTPSQFIELSGDGEEEGEGEGND